MTFKTCLITLKLVQWISVLVAGVCFLSGWVWGVPVFAILSAACSYATSADWPLIRLFMWCDGLTKSQAESALDALKAGDDAA